VLYAAAWITGEYSSLLPKIIDGAKRKAEDDDEEDSESDSDDEQHEVLLHSRCCLLSRN
jgi:hypothetical protein